MAVGGEDAGCAGRPTSRPAESSVEQPSVDLDAQYRHTLETADALLVTLEQVPENRTLLQRQEVELREGVVLLSRLAAEAEQLREARAVTGEETSASATTTGTPAGPISVSTEPTPEDERRRQEIATMRGPLPTPMPGEGPPPTSLAASSALEVQAACAEALEQLSAFTAAQAQQPPDLEAMGNAIDRLRAVLAELGSPKTPARPADESPPGRPGP
jgi:hypothetical protein